MFQASDETAEGAETKKSESEAPLVEKVYLYFNCLSVISHLLIFVSDAQV